MRIWITEGLRKWLMSQLVLFNFPNREEKRKEPHNSPFIPQTTRTFHHFEFDEILVAPTWNEVRFFGCWNCHARNASTGLTGNTRAWGSKNNNSTTLCLSEYHKKLRKTHTHYFDCRWGLRFHNKWRNCVHVIITKPRLWLQSMSLRI